MLVLVLLLMSLELLLLDLNLGPAWSRSYFSTFLVLVTAPSHLVTDCFSGSHLVTDGFSASPIVTFGFSGSVADAASSDLIFSIRFSRQIGFGASFQVFLGGVFMPRSLATMFRILLNTLVVAISIP